MVGQELERCFYGIMIADVPMIKIGQYFFDEIQFFDCGAGPGSKLRSLEKRG